MFWKIADELYSLTKKVVQETNYCVHFEVNERGIHVWIREKDKTEFDGIYDIYKRYASEEQGIDHYEAAKKHLERLLKENV